MSEMDENKGKKKRRNKSEQEPQYFPDPSTISDADAHLFFPQQEPASPEPVSEAEEAPVAFVSLDSSEAQLEAENEFVWEDEAPAPAADIFAEDVAPEEASAPSLPPPVSDVPPVRSTLPPPVSDIPPGTAAPIVPEESASPAPVASELPVTDSTVQPDLTAEPAIVADAQAAIDNAASDITVEADPAALSASPTDTTQDSATVASTTAASTSPAASLESSNFYDVQRGDTLESIASRFNTTVAVLAQLNSISNTTKLSAGQRLKLPPSPATQSKDAPAASTSPAASLESNNFYDVQRGDTLESIASRFNTTVAVLAQLNSISNTTKLSAGRRLKLPTSPATQGKDTPAASSETSDFYDVQRGDTLESIASRFNTTVAVLAQLNSISNTTKLSAGQRLKLPPSPATQGKDAPAASTPQTQGKDATPASTAAQGKDAPAASSTPQTQGKDAPAASATTAAQGKDTPASSATTQNKDKPAASTTTPATQGKDAPAASTTTAQGKDTPAASTASPATQAKDAPAAASTTATQGKDATPASTTSASTATTTQGKDAPTASSTTPATQTKDASATSTASPAQQTQGKDATPASTTTPATQGKDAPAASTPAQQIQGKDATPATSTPATQSKDAPAASTASPATQTKDASATSSATAQGKDAPASSATAPTAQGKDAPAASTTQAQGKDAPAASTLATQTQGKDAPTASSTTSQGKDATPASSTPAAQGKDAPATSTTSTAKPVTQDKDDAPASTSTAKPVTQDKDDAQADTPKSTETVAADIASPIGEVVAEESTAETSELAGDEAAAVETPLTDDAATIADELVTDEASTTDEAVVSDEAVTDEAAVSDMPAPVTDEAAVSDLPAPTVDEAVPSDVPAPTIDEPVTDEAAVSDLPETTTDEPVTDEAAVSDVPAPTSDEPVLNPLAEPFPTATSQSRPIPQPVEAVIVATTPQQRLERPLSPLIATDTLSTTGERAPIFWRWGDMLWMVSAFVAIFLLQAQGFQAPDTLRTVLSIITVSLLTLASLGFSAWAVLTYVERRRARRRDGEAMRIFFMAQCGLWLAVMITTIVGLSLVNNQNPARVMVYVISSLALIWWGAKLVLRILQRHLLRSYDIITNSALFVASFFALAFPIVAAGIMHSNNLSRGYIFKVGEAYGSANIIALTMSIIATLVFFVVVIPEQMRYADGTNRFKRAMEFVGNFLAGNTLEVSGLAVGVAIAVKDTAGLGLAALLITAVGLIVVPYGILDKIRSAREKSGYEEAFQVVLILMSISITLVSLLNFGFAIAAQSSTNAIISLIAGGLAIISTSIEIVELVITGGEGTIWKRGSNLIANILLILATVMAILGAASTFNQSLNNGSIAYAAIGLSLYFIAFIIKFLVEADLLGKVVDILIWIRDRITRRATVAPVVADAAPEGIAPTGD